MKIYEQSISYQRVKNPNVRLTRINELDIYFEIEFLFF